MCGGSLYIERELAGETAVCCINGHRFEKASDLKYVDGRGGRIGYKNQDNKSVSHQQSGLLTTLGRGIKERKA